MYNHFFGFKERPFKLVPNPDYLFLSKSHEEALAHLRYAVTDGEGFVEIIGEIGTGKTMLCRTFLESLDDDTESAYIFNPRMDALDLLKAINDEFGIPSDHHSTKALIDDLNTFLIEKKAAGKKVILLIDEAQNLGSDVLEQIRLLSNLETTKDKLLQIILVGQPELGEMLDSYELRQLGQRISLSCRLHPLTYAETKEYIAHRIQVASQRSAAVFSTGAMRRIYRYSRGIPRLINIACDRSLLTAFGRHRLKVSGSIAAAAIQELLARGDLRRNFAAGNTGRVAAASAVLAILVFGLFFSSELRRTIFSKPAIDSALTRDEKQTISSGQTIAGPSATSLPESNLSENVRLSESAHPKDSAIRAVNPAAKTDTIAQPIDFKQLLIDNSSDFSKTASFEKLLKTWGIVQHTETDLNEIADDPAFFSMAAQRSGLVATEIFGNLERIVKLNIPSILLFKHSLDTDPVFLTVVRATPTAMVFSGTGTMSEISVPYARVMENWTGIGFVFWKNFYNYQGIIPINAPGESVITLKLHLRDIGYNHIDISGRYDLATRTAVKAIQARHGIPIDGYVGPLTKIVLYNEKPSLAIPHLWEQMKLPDEIKESKITQQTPEPVLLNPEPSDN